MMEEQLNTTQKVTLKEETPLKEETQRYEHIVNKLL